ncbi:MAG: type II toxin-antitoxin system RelE/ParE family toxin [Nanoarchaeota archaeon]|nr:type II toxin-antitoxin system RelE/ParE family toxin [Nanoarchaeota archaeon]MBU1322045.1 type II toxin-antitoxin system RelE/ParE family toxin [Nanoarchaeota archaeon]MBU1597237.1 type II toxin-antitoxin system RelE/ParE family toxin [Nanoarchaeota archaeon]MBU2440718.1 type II toxin-antitoxin system RelE/ParE family toxin [Nanoarchaeota archaeon]
MTTYLIKETKEFKRNFNKLPADIKKRFEIQFRRILENPFSTGKPLGYKWFRELKNNIYRAYYLVYEQEVIVLLVTISDKKTQRYVINFIKKNRKLFESFVKEKKEL